MANRVIDGSTAMSLARRLAFPRFPGGPEEGRARGLLAAAVKGLGYVTEEQGFDYDARAADAVRLLSPLLPFLALGLCALLSRRAPVVSWLAATAAAGAAVFFVRWPWLEGLYRGRRRHSANLIARLPEEARAAELAGRRDFPRVLFVAHVDSKSQRLGIVARAILASTLLVATVAAWALLGARALGPGGPAAPLSPALLGSLAVSLACALPLCLNVSGDLSPGALDNASGCAALVEVARALRGGEPLPYEPVFVFTGAEEAGMVGAARLAERLARDSRPGNILFVNLDGTGAGHGLLVLVHGPRRPETKEAVKEAAAACGVRVRFARLIPAAGVDGVPLGSRGMRGVSLLPASIGRAVLAVHRPTDRPGNLEPEAMRTAGLAAMAIAEALAARPGPALRRRFR